LQNKNEILIINRVNSTQAPKNAPTSTLTAKILQTAKSTTNSLRKIQFYLFFLSIII